MSNVLSINHLTKIYAPDKKGGSPFTAVDDISFDLKQGEILGLLGPNGAGKSTTISMLLGVLSPTRGEIWYGSQNLKQHRSKIMESVTFASTYIKMPWRLTVLENLSIYGYMYQLPKQEFLSRTKKLLEYFGVWNQRDKTMGQLSAGQVTRIMLAKAFIPHPKIVLLDEPTASLDPDIAHEVRSFILSQQKEFGTSMIYTSHNMDEVTEVCDRVVFLKQGKILDINTPDKLAASVSTAHMHLLMKDKTDAVTQIATSKKLPYQITGKTIDISIDEHEIADFLQTLAKKHIEYSQITIDKPNLEDYFLSHAKTKKI